MPEARARAGKPNEQEYRDGNQTAKRDILHNRVAAARHRRLCLKLRLALIRTAIRGRRPGKLGSTVRTELRVARIRQAAVGTMHNHAYFSESCS